MKYGDGADVIYYAYANKEFTDLEGEPKPLFIPENKKSCIDGDIVYKDGIYHLFYKTEGHGNGIRVATTRSLTSGQWEEEPDYKQQTPEAVEGAGTFKLIGQNKYILMYDVYMKGKYQFTETTDLKNFKVIDSEVKMNFHPRHGTIIPITRAELKRITDKWPSKEMGNMTIPNNPVLQYKYFFYFSGNPVAGGGKQIGVAVADSPIGPFKDLGHPIITESPVGHGQQIDVDVFTDPVSGKSYLYWGNGYMAGAELNEDMVSIKKNTLTVLTPKGGSLKDYAFREAAYVFYRNGLYYFMWSVDDTGSPNYHVAYGTSKSPLGPIKVAKKPVVLIQDPAKEIYGPAHNAVLQIPGTDEWYIVYHRINKNFIDREKGPGVHREVCIDRMEFNPDGTIRKVVPTL